jgi:UDP-3-O-[3-hydroxymyristoyl] glucosamine N-acyltransferase
MEFTAQQIASIIEGEIVGNPEVKINTFAKIEEGKEGAISFLANPKYNHHLYDCESSVIIIAKDLELHQEVKATLLKVKDPYQSFGLLMRTYQQLQTKKAGISKLTDIHESATIGEHVFIDSFCKIGANVSIGDNSQIYGNVTIGDNVKIGHNTIVYSNVSIYNDCELGNHCTFHSGVIIGGDGFGFAPNSENNYQKIPQIGNVIIEDHVELGANTTIDRATMGSTIIRKGVKLDNLVQIAHNVEVGENTVIAAQTGIAGSTKIGKNCMIGGQVGIAGHLTIADYTKIGAKAGIGSNITEEGKILLGAPAFELNDFKKSHVVFTKLPEIYRLTKDLEKEINKLKKQK